MAQAARLGDPIGHSPTMSWLLKGLLIGAAIAVTGVVIAGTGGLAAVAIVGGAAAAGAGLGELLSTMSWAPKEACGAIIGACSSNVFTNGLRAARAHIDQTQCAKHPTPPPPIATGSATVFINGQPAARMGDSIVCGAVIVAGSGNVFIGGGTAQTDPISPENLVPGWVQAALFVVGGASALALAGPVIAIGGMVGGIIGAIGGERLGGKLFGEGSDGQKWSMLGGSLVGGGLGAKGAPGAWNFAKRVEVSVEPGTLGMNGGNVKFRLKPSDETHKTTPMDRDYETEHLPGNRAPAWVRHGQQAKVKYLTPKEREEYQIHFRDGKAYDAKGNIFDTGDAVNGRAIFVMDEHGTFYASKMRELGEFHHSSFMSGKPVAAAGEIESIEGMVVAISDQSGHYKPAPEFMEQAMSELANNGVNMRYVLPEFPRKR